MKKVVYVEGVTELVFVYNLVCTHYDYDGSRVRIRIINLDPVAGLQIPADYGTDNAPDYFQIVCSGGDSGVISRIKERYHGHVEAGFDIVVGLKDVYGKAYINIAGHYLDEEKVSQLIEIQREQLCQEVKASLCFAIMEIEAWLLGMDVFLKREFPGITIDSEVNPETTYVHPYDIIHEAFSSVGVQFEKHWGNILAILGRISKEDFERLYASPLCKSFNVFYDVLFGMVPDEA